MKLKNYYNINREKCRTRAMINSRIVLHRLRIWYSKSKMYSPETKEKEENGLVWRVHINRPMRVNGDNGGNQSVHSCRRELT